MYSSLILNFYSVLFLQISIILKGCEFKLSENSSQIAIHPHHRSQIALYLELENFGVGGVIWYTKSEAYSQYTCNNKKNILENKNMVLNGLFHYILLSGASMDSSF
jgi:hypothetical protein